MTASAYLKSAAVTALGAGSVLVPPLEATTQTKVCEPCVSAPRLNDTTERLLFGALTWGGYASTELNLKPDEHSSI